MTDLHTEAMKKLPEHLRDGKTHTVQWYWGNEPAVYAAHPDHAPMCYRKSVGDWRIVECKAADAEEEG